MNELKDTESIRSMPDDTKVAYIADCELYMEGTQQYAVHTTCCAPLYIRSYLTQLYRYYEVYPERIADVIYVSKNYNKDIADELAEKYGYSVKEMTAGWILSMEK
jgi:hypothetical protein